jgi:hypothetical protein
MSFTCTVHLQIHQWDTDGMRVKLPKKMKIPVTIEDEDNVSVSGIHDEAMDKASDITGYCIIGCSLIRIDFQ